MTLEQRRALLRSYLKEGDLIKQYRAAQAMELEAMKNKYICDPEDAIVCILHGEVRMTEKILQQVLLRGMLSNPALGKYAFVQVVELVMNEQVFGKIDEHGRDFGRWRFLLKYGKLGEVKFSGPDACKVLSGFSFIIDLCLRDSSDSVR